MNRFFHSNPQVLLAPDDGAGDGGGDDNNVSELSQDLADLGDADENADENSDDNADDNSDDSNDDNGDDDSNDDDGADDDSSDENEEENEDENEEDEDEEDKDGDKKSKKGKGKEGDDEADSTGKVSAKSLEKAFPGILKKFPGLRSTLYLTPQFLEIYPDVTAAKEASAKATEFDRMEGDIAGKGDPTILLKSLSDNNPKALKKVAQNFGQALRKVDEDAYVALANPIIEELCYYAAATGTKNKDKNLVLSAKHLMNFVFANGGEIVDISKRGDVVGEKPKTDDEKQLEADRKQFAAEKFNSAVTKLSDSLSPTINTIIESKLGKLTKFESKQVVKETRQELDRVLGADKAFNSQMSGLWKRASEQNYSEDSLSRIKRAWLDRARVLAPGIRNKLLKEALDARTGGGSERDEQPKKRSFGSQNGAGRKSSSRPSVPTDPSKVNWRKTSDMDILNSK